MLALSVQALLWASEQFSKERGQVGRGLCTGRSGLCELWAGTETTMKLVPLAGAKGSKLSGLPRLA